MTLRELIAEIKKLNSTERSRKVERQRYRCKDCRKTFTIVTLLNH